MKRISTKTMMFRVLLLVISLTILTTLSVCAVTYKYSAGSPPEGAQYSSDVERWNGKGSPLSGQGLLTATGTIDTATLNNIGEKEVHSRVRATMKALNDALNAEDPETEGISKSDYYVILNRISRKFDGDMGVVMLLSENYKADMIAASQALSGFQQVINLIMGLIAWALLLFSGLTTVLDLAYIFIPMLQTKTSQGGNYGTSGGSDRPKWVTEEAYSAVKDSTNSVGAQGQSSGYKSAGLIYVKRRAWAFVCLVFALTLVLSSSFMTFVASAVGGVLRGLLETIGLM